MTSAVSRLTDFCSKYGGAKIKPLQATVPIPSRLLKPIREAIPEILAAQRVILKKLLQDSSPQEVMKLFAVPSEFEPWMEVLRNPDAELPMLRVDVLADVHGKPWICEINIDSSLGGGEAHQFRRIEETCAGQTISLSPYDHLASLIGRLLEENRCNKVCILDWSIWEGYGAFGMDWLQLALQTALPGVEVGFATEKNALEKLDRETLVYRVFPGQDALTDPSLTAQIFSKAGYILSDFSGELMGSKIWMALLHNPKYRKLMTAEMICAIDQTVPFTIVVSDSNLQYLLLNKDRFYFKSSSDFGGHGVICGKSTSTQKLIGALQSQPNKGWIAQWACVPKPIDVWPLHANAPELNNVVMGLYRIGVNWSGVLLRTHASSDVINVASGSAVGWGYEV